MSLNSGERQVTSNIAEIRRDHVARYEFVRDRIATGSTVIDFACGIGYGSFILGGPDSKASLVLGFDIDEESVEYAKSNYSYSDTIEFHVADGANPPKLPESDVAVCFETVEHIRDPRPLLRALRAAKELYVSVPNEVVMPWKRADGSVTAFHYRHYTQPEFVALLNSCGWSVEHIYGQLDSESDVDENCANGRTIIAYCVRYDPPPSGCYDDALDAIFAALPKHAPLPYAPEEIAAGKHVAILGLGGSVTEFLELTKRAGGRHEFCDEVWAINALGNVFDCDLIFHMDDIRIQEIRAAARPQSNIAAMVRWIKNSKVPVVTSRSHPDYPALVEFPLEDVLNHLGHDYFNNTAAYAVAMAIHIGATRISCWGMDYSYANVHDAEKGRACVEFWLGQAHARGIEISLPAGTTLMDSNCTRAARLYGYDTLDVEFDIQSSGELKLKFTERTELPTADQIEANYDHSAPIASQHQSTKE